MDNLGLPIESQGNLDKTHSGLLSSIMKNAARLHTLLLQPHDSQEGQSPAVAKSGNSQDVETYAKIQFNGDENLLIKHSNGLTLGVRQTTASHQ